MKKFILSLILATGVLAGCTSTPQQETMYQEFEREYVKPVMEGELTIATMYENQLLDEAATAFMEKYPDVTVTINAGINREDFMIESGEGHFSFDSDAFNIAIENYYAQLNMRLMNGSAEDIFFTRGLPVMNYINMGMFEDLSFYLDNSPEINNENHFMNVIHAFEDDDSKILQIPITFDIHRMIYFNSVLVEESGLSIGEDVKSITYLQAVEFGISILENMDKENAYLAWSFDNILNDLIFDNIWEFINIKDKEVNLDSDEFISLLETVQELQDFVHYPNFDEEFINGDVVDNYYYALDQSWGWGLAHTVFQSLREDGEMYPILPLADPKGDVHLRSLDILAINSASENKDLAWEFIRFFLSHEFEFSFSGIPVNKNKFESILEDWIEWENNYYEIAVDYDEANEMMQGFISQINKYTVKDLNIETMIWEILYEEFFDGEQSAEETANILQTRVHRYVHETY